MKQWQEYLIWFVCYGLGLPHKEWSDAQRFPAGVQGLSLLGVIFIQFGLFGLV